MQFVPKWSNLSTFCSPKKWATLVRFGCLWEAEIFGLVNGKWEMGVVPRDGSVKA